MYIGLISIQKSSSHKPPSLALTISHLQFVNPCKVNFDSLEALNFKLHPYKLVIFRSFVLFLLFPISCGHIKENFIFYDS